MPRIGHHEACNHIATALQRQCTIAELRVTQPVPEREQRRRLGPIKPAISDVGAFGVSGIERRLVLWQVVKILPVLPFDQRAAGQFRIGRLRDVAREGDREVARRVDRSGQHTRDRQPAALARIPSGQHRTRLVEPRHRDRPAGFEHHHAPRIGRGDRVDQGVLPVGQGQRGNVGALVGKLLGKEHDQIGGAGGGSGALLIGAVIVGDLRARQQIAQCCERGRRRVQLSVVDRLAGDRERQRGAANRIDLR